MLWMTRKHCSYNAHYLTQLHAAQNTAQTSCANICFSTPDSCSDGCLLEVKEQRDSFTVIVQQYVTFVSYARLDIITWLNAWKAGKRRVTQRRDKQMNLSEQSVIRNWTFSVRYFLRDLVHISKHAPFIFISPERKLKIYSRYFLESAAIQKARNFRCFRTTAKREIRLLSIAVTRATGYINQLESVQLRRHCNSKATPTSRQLIWHIISIFFVRKYCVLGSSAWQPQMQVTWRHAPCQQ